MTWSLSRTSTAAAPAAAAVGAGLADHCAPQLLLIGRGLMMVPSAAEQHLLHLLLLRLLLDG